MGGYLTYVITIQHEHFFVVSRTLVDLTNQVVVAGFDLVSMSLSKPLGYRSRTVIIILFAIKQLQIQSGFDKEITLTLIVDY